MGATDHSADAIHVREVELGHAPASKDRQHLMLEDAPAVVRSRLCDSRPEFLVVPGSNEVLDGDSIARWGKAVIAQPRERLRLAKCIALCLGAHVLAHRPAAIVMVELDGAQPPTRQRPAGRASPVPFARLPAIVAHHGR